MSRPDRTYFYTAREPAIPGAVYAESALLGDADRADGHFWIYIFRRELWLKPIKPAGTVGTGRYAKSAANTPIVIHQDKTIFVFIGSSRWADFNTWRIVTVVTLHR
jgi:hypothetical protein